MRVPSLVVTIGLLITGVSGAQAVRAVTPFDVGRYQGEWYEIAKYPIRYQAACASATVARYTIAADGSVGVANRCRKADGTTITANGVARRVGPSGSAQLEVRFAPAWLSWLPAVWAPYWVFDIDPAYTLAAVGQPEREYLWILSRTPTVDPQRYASLLERIAAAGYDVRRLEMTRQP